MRTDAAISIPRRPNQAPTPAVLWHVAVPRLLEVVFLAVVAIYLAWYIQRFAVFQGDLRTYLSAAKAVWAGLDPYRPEVLSELAMRRVMPFVYPPAGILPFLWLPVFPQPFVMPACMWAKAGLLALLVAHWRRSFPAGSLIPLILVTLYAFNRAAQWDLSSGNIAILEAALLFAAFACWARGRRRAFAALVVAASVFKLAPAVFLLLLLVPLENSPARPRLLFASVAVVVALLVLPMWIPPFSHWGSFLVHAPDAVLYGDSNPSSLGFLTALVSRAGLGSAAVVWVGRALWCVFAVVAVWAGRQHIRSLWARRRAMDWIMTAVLLYVLLHPRIMAYGYVLAAPAILYFAPRPFVGRVGLLLWALILSAQGLSQQLTHFASGSLFVLYAPFLFALSAWLSLCARSEERPIAGPVPTTA